MLCNYCTQAQIGALLLYTYIEVQISGIYCAGIRNQRVGIHSSLNKESPIVELQLNHLAQTPTLFMKGQIAKNLK